MNQIDVNQGDELKNPHLTDAVYKMINDSPTTARRYKSLYCSDQQAIDIAESFRESTKGIVRWRIEDLGRIAERLRAVLDGPIFEEKRNKHNPQPWDEQKVDEFMMGLEDLRNELSDIWYLARHGDEVE